MNDSALNPLFVTCPKGLQYALEKEMGRLGAKNLKPTPAGVACSVDKACMYRLLLWSRIANRVILQLDTQKVDSVEDIYQQVSRIDWSEHFDASKSFAVDFLGTNRFVKNSTFGALKVKDAIVDQFRAASSERPSIDKQQPDIRISARLQKGELILGIDLSGDSLHKRGYRLATGKAPLKENLAAGLLELCGWPDSFSGDASFIDPMCGSGTLLIEAGMALCKRAPGLAREHWGFNGWAKHDTRLWSALLEEAKETFSRARAECSARIVGFDQDSRVVSRAWENIQQAGLEDVIHVEKRELSDFVLFERLKPGLLLSNPPYGERLGEVESLGALYKQFGQLFEKHLQGWTAGIFTGNHELGKRIGWRSDKQYKLFNGAIESQLLRFQLNPDNRFKNEWLSVDDKLKDPSFWSITNPERAEMFKNRLLKNKKQLEKWAKKNDISCYRLYDADMPEFSVAVDIYTSIKNERWLHVQEYVAPKSIDEKAAIERLREALAVLPETLDIPEDRIALKRRQVQKGSKQYEKESQKRSTFEVLESGVRLKVNLWDYLDTGLFLDHRPMRRFVQANSRGKRVLNLFCYTGAVTSHAVVGGAEESLSIDMSRTYLDWAKDNLCLNEHGAIYSQTKHQFLQADCLAWLEEANVSRTGKFDLIFLDPPSFSNSKRMEGVLDIQRDHAAMIGQAMTLLSDEGVLIFSNNLRRFKLSDDILDKYQVKDLKRESLDKDFERNSGIHHCWHIRRRT